MPTPTPSQQQCIKQKGNVIVVASAGTGKTSTLVQRCLHLLLQENCSLENILMVTFTEAAAAQMRVKIREELLKLTADPAHAARAEHLRQQASLLDVAQISTLHSFCLQLVRQHFQDLGIAPAVMVLDNKQTTPLITQTLDRIFEGHYAGNTPESRNVQALVAQFGSGSDEPIRSLVLKVHRFAQVLPDCDSWLVDQIALYSRQSPEAWKSWLIAGLNRWREFWLPELQARQGQAPAVDLCIAALAKPFPPGETPVEIEQIVDTIKALAAADDDANADTNWPRGTIGAVRKPLNSFFVDADFLRSALVPGENGVDPLQQDWDWVRPHMLTLLQLAREFGEQFAKAKRDLGGVDFSDLEQFALKLLGHSAIAERWREKFHYIFVDEFQDINRAQDAILNLISRSGKAANRFLVGDVKQSIYRFRLADPAIFCEYEANWGKPRSKATRIPLSDNFRSRESILVFVNELFKVLMRPAIGGLDYAEDVHLRFGDRPNRLPLARQDGTTRVELHFIDEADAGNGEYDDEDDSAASARAALVDLQNTEREARLTALRLRELKESGHQVWDPDLKAMRPVEWQDMVVLMRSPSSRVEAYAKEFFKCGVPLAAARDGFFEAIEITDLLSVLKLLDNPLQDVPLLAVLRSSLAGLSLDELADIRASFDDRPFWLALNKYHQRNARTEKSAPGNGSPSTREKVAQFLQSFNYWRDLARQGALSTCLERILLDTHYLALLQAEPRGEERVANVRRLLDLVREYDPWQRQGLYRFLRFVQQQQEAEVDFEPAFAQTSDAVRLMTVHGSKGLEFPVVALCNTASIFNQTDLRADVLLHSVYGVCPKVKPPETMASYPSVVHWLAKREEQRALWGEELRLLYVALTRARDTLLIIGSHKAPGWRDEAPAPVTDRALVSASSYFGWLKAWLPNVTEAAHWTDERCGGNGLLKWTIYSADDPRLLPPAPGQEPRADSLPAPEPTRAELFTLRQRLGFQYPHAAATVEPAIKRISEVIWTANEADDPSQLSLGLTGPQPPTRHASAPRKFSALAAARIGDAHHRLLENLELAEARRLDTLERAAREMCGAGLFTADEFKALNLPAIHQFWTSNIGQEILACPEDQVQRELPFTLRLTPADLAEHGLCVNAEELEGETFIGRGQIDLAVILPKEIWLLDFKTDRVKQTELDAKVAPYSRQLKLYALAVQRIYGRPVTNRWLHFLSIGRTVSV